MKKYIITLIACFLSNSFLFSSEKDVVTDYIFKLLETNVASQNIETKTLIEDIGMLYDKGLLSSFVNSIKKNDLKIFENNIFEMFEFTYGENPSISTIIVSSDNLYFLRVNFKYNVNKIENRLIIRTLHDTYKDRIIDLIRNLKEEENRNAQKTDNNVILLFKIKNSEGKYNLNAIYPPNGFIKEDKNSLISIRNYILSLFGLNPVYSDFSNMPTYSLQKKIQKNSIYPYKNLDDVIKIFLSNRPNFQKDFYKRIWQYYTSSDSLVDNYMAVWVFFINRKLTIDRDLDLSFLLDKQYETLILNLKNNNDVLSKYILYCYYRNNDDIKRSDEYKLFLLKNNVSDILI